MYGRCHQRPGRRLFPKSTPPGLNYAVVTGKLLGEPREGGGPGGNPVLVADIEFPVAHPEHPRLLWTFASYSVEVPGDVGGRDVEELRKGTSVLVAGQLSQRLSLQDGRSERSPALLASLLKVGPQAEGGR
jgi:hypothetical protein